MRILVLVALIGALAAPALATCFEQPAPATMKCCTALRDHECRTMPLMSCCAIDPTGRPSPAGRIESTAATLMYMPDAVMPAWRPAAQIARSAPMSVSPRPLSPPHLIHSVLLI